MRLFTCSRLFTYDLIFLESFLIIQRLNFLYNLGRNSHRDRVVRNVLGHNSASTDGASLANRDTRQDCDVGSKPAVVTDRDGLGVLDVVSSGLETRFVCGRDQADAVAKEDSVANRDVSAVEDNGARRLTLACVFQQRVSVDLLEVGIESVANSNVAPIIHLQTGLDVDIGTNLAKNLLDHVDPRLSDLGSRCAVIWHIGVELLCKPSSVVSGLEQLRRFAAVEHARDHLLVVIAPWDVRESLGEGDGLLVLLGADRGNHFGGGELDKEEE